MSAGDLSKDIDELVNPVSNEENIRMLNKIKKNNEKYGEKYKQGPRKIIDTLQRVPVMAFGGNRDKYYMKYLKYKQKYLELKNKK